MFPTLRAHNSERGQMLVIVALGLTVLIGMAGLVIDGGMALSNRRQVQNAADAAALAGTRVLGLDLKYRAVNADVPAPPPAPFANVDQEVCDAINAALDYNENNAQSIAAIDCYGGTDDAQYVDFDRNVLGRVGDGVPPLAQGVHVKGTGQSDTFLMGVLGIQTINIGADATAVAGPGEPPLGALMPFVAQNPLGPFVPGEQYQIRSEDEGACDTASVSPLVADALAGGTVMASYVEPTRGDSVFAAVPPSVPVATPGSSTFITSITVTLASPTNGAKIHYTTDGSAPTGSSPQYSSALTFTSTTTLKAVATKGGQTSEIGTFTYTQADPPAVVTATPGSQTFTSPFTVTLSSAGPNLAGIYYTTDGTNPVVGGAGTTLYSGPISISTTTQIRAMARNNLGINSAVTQFNYTDTAGTQPPVSNPVAPHEFETTVNVTLTTPTPGADIYYTVNGSTPTTSSTKYTGPLSLVSTTTVKAFATVGGNDSVVVEFLFTKTGPVCPELASGNFGWIDYSGGSNSNADLKNEIKDPSSADIDWYYRECTSASDTNCRDIHDADDAADDHWLIEGTPGHRDSSLSEVCDGWLGKIITIPIWDDYQMMDNADPNGNNAVFHVIGFASFIIDGVIDNKNNGDASNDACGAGVSLGGTPNDKGFVGTYVDSFVGTQVAPCIPSPDGTNPCQNLQNDRLEINLAD